MNNVLKKDVLVINKEWTPLTVESVKKAVTQITKGVANFMDPSDWQDYDYEEWMELPVRDQDRQPEESRVIQTGRDRETGEHRELRAPVVILLTDYSEIGKMDVKLTPENLMLRDGGCCQYCGCKLVKSPKDDPRCFSMDHVWPKSRGGPKSWENIVSCCKRCNSKKGMRTLEQAKMTLIKQPVRPNLHPVYCRSIKHRHKDWDRFLDPTKFIDYAKSVQK